jgi:hypothetical protein
MSEVEVTMKRTGSWWLAGAALLVVPVVACGGGESDKPDDSTDMPVAGGAGSSSPGMPTAGNGSNPGSGSSTAGGSSTPSAGASGGNAPSGGGTTGAMAGSSAAGSQAEPPPAIEELDPNVDWTALTLVFAKLYSAYDGTHLFQVPVKVDGATVELAGWESIPAGAVTFDPDPVGGGVLITVAQAVENITIAAHNEKLGGTATLHVTMATPEEWKIGEARYANGVDYQLPQLNFADLIDPNWVPPPTPKNLACNNCHSTGAKYFEIQHTPTQIGALSDEVLIEILTTGMKPMGVPYHVLPAELEHLYPEFHTWEANESERKGLIVYLRSLTPMGQSDIVLPDDFGMAP